MISYRITKYNPDNRNDQGHYLDDSEWTAISDIGKPKYNNVTYQEYEKIESAYVEAVQVILREKNIEILQIKSLELYDNKEDFDGYKIDGRLRNIDVDFDKEIKTLKNNQKLSLSEIQKLTRLILRETIWMLLGNNECDVKFGYDYYMYVTCEKLTSKTICKIESLGLFVEPNTGQIEYTIIDENGNKIE